MLLGTGAYTQRKIQSKMRHRNEDDFKKET